MDRDNQAVPDILEQQYALREHDLRFRALADAFPHMIWSTLPDGFHDYYNAEWYDYTGMPDGSTDGEAWNGMFHPGDQERAWTVWRESLASGEPYEIEYRLRHHSGDYRWVLGRARAIRGDDGRIMRWIGTCTDIHEQKLQLEQNEVLSRELSHRIKNIFAVIGGLIGLSARTKPEMKPFVGELRERIDALGRAHEFVRPHSQDSRPASVPGSLHGVLEEILAPYPALEEGRIRISGADLSIDDRAATPVALLIHELATNAMKYGALSVPEGTIDIRIEERGSTIALCWIEKGGPPLAQVPERTGFGTRLIELSINRQLGGEIERHWKPQGLVAEFTVERARLSRGAIG